MTDPPLEPFDAELDALLEGERQARPPRDALERVWSRLGGGVPNPGSGNGRAPPRYGWLSSHAAEVAVAAFVLGGATGAGLYAATEKSPSPRVVYVDRPAPLPPMTRVPPSLVAPPPATLAPSAFTGPRAAVPSPSGESLSAERAVLDQARSDIASGDAAGALVLLQDHARRFRKPQLFEEREALAIQSLVALAHYDEARARAARFREASPNSLFVPAIETALESIP